MPTFLFDCTIVLHVQDWEVEAEDEVEAIRLIDQPQLRILAPSPGCSDTTARNAKMTGTWRPKEPEANE